MAGSFCISAGRTRIIDISAPTAAPRGTLDHRYPGKGLALEPSAGRCSFRPSRGLASDRRSRCLARGSGVGELVQVAAKIAGIALFPAFSEKVDQVWVEAGGRVGAYPVEIEDRIHLTPRPEREPDLRLEFRERSACPQGASDFLGNGWPHQLDAKPVLLTERAYPL